MINLYYEDLCMYGFINWRDIKTCLSDFFFVSVLNNTELIALFCENYNYKSSLRCTINCLMVIWNWATIIRMKLNSFYFMCRTLSLFIGTYLINVMRFIIYSSSIILTIFVSVNILYINNVYVLYIENMEGDFF